GALFPMELRIVRIDGHWHIPNPNPAFGKGRSRFGTFKPFGVLGRIIKTQKSFHAEHSSFLVSYVGIINRAANEQPAASPIRPNTLTRTDRRLLVFRVTRLF